VELPELDGGDAALDVELVLLQAGPDLVGFDAGVDRGAGVAGALGGGEEGLVAGDLAELGLELFGARLDLLEAEDVRFLLLHPENEALLGDGADAVDVPGDDLHPPAG